MTVRGVWGSMEFSLEDEENSFGVILDDGTKSVEVPFRKDMGPEMALNIMMLSGLGNTNAAAQLRAEVTKANAKRGEDQEIVRWLKETKGQTGWIVTKEDREEFKKQKKFWGKDGGC